MQIRQVLYYFILLLGLLSQHMEVPRLRGESELQLLAYTTATAMPDPSHVRGLHDSSGQCQILNPLSRARDRTCILMDTSQICLCCATIGTPFVYFVLQVFFNDISIEKSQKIPINVTLQKQNFSSLLRRAAQ